MGYQTESGRWANTHDVSLQDGIIEATGDGEAVEIGDRGSARLTLAVLDAFATGTNAKQSIAVTDATGGTFALSFGGDDTDAIAHDADAATVQAALESLPSIGAGNVACTGGALGTAPVVVEFVGALRSAPQTTITSDSTLLAGAGTEAVAVTSTTAGVAGSWSLIAKAQTSPDGSSWTDLQTFATLSAVGSERKIMTGVDRFLRATFTVTGADPEINCTLAGEAV